MIFKKVLYCWAISILSLVGFSSCHLNSSFVSKNEANFSSQLFNNNAYRARNLSLFEVQEKYLIALDMNYGIRVIDANSHEEVSGLEINDTSYFLLKKDTNLFIPTKQGDIYIVDISNPLRLNLVSVIKTGIPFYGFVRLNIINNQLEVFTEHDYLNYNLKKIKNPTLVEKKFNGYAFANNYVEYQDNTEKKVLTKSDFKNLFNLSEMNDKDKASFQDTNKLFRFENMLILIEPVLDNVNLKVLKGYTLSTNNTPQLAFSMNLNANALSSVDYANKVLYLAYSHEISNTTSSILALDLSTPSNPKRISELNIPGSFFQIQHTINKIHAISSGSIYSFSPSLSKDFKITPLEIIFGSLALLKNTLFVELGNKIAKFDTSDANELKRITDLKTTDINTQHSSLYTHNNLLFVRSNKIDIYDLNQSENPISQLKLDSSPLDISFDNNLMYIRDSNHGISIVDIQTPHNPVILSRITDIEEGLSKAKNGILYIVSKKGLITYNVRTPQRPIQLDSLKGNFRDLKVIENYLYLLHNKGLKVFDISTNQPLTPVTSIETDKSLGSPAFLDMWINKDELYIMKSNSQLVKYSIANPKSPRMIYEKHLKSSFQTIIFSDSAVIVEQFKKIQIAPTIEAILEKEALR